MSQGVRCRPGFAFVDEVDEWLDGYGYNHLLVRALDDR